MSNVQLPGTGAIVETVDNGSGAQRQIVGAAPYSFVPISTSSQFGLSVVSATSLIVPGAAAQCVVTVEGNSVRYTYDGTTPTSSIGHMMTSGQAVMFSGSVVLSNLLFIQVGAGALINVSYTR